MPNITQIPSNRAPIADLNTGISTREWFLFFSHLFKIAGGGSNATTIPDIEAILELLRLRSTAIAADGIDGEDGQQGMPGPAGDRGPQGLTIPGMDGHDADDNIMPQPPATNGNAATFSTLTTTDNITAPKQSGKGIRVDYDAPTFGWRDILGTIETRGLAGGGAAAIPDFVLFRDTIYKYRWGTIAPDNHMHEAFLFYHIPHDYVPGTDIFIHVHWSQNVVDTGGAAGVPGVAKWYFDMSYAKAFGTPGGAADAFNAIITQSVTQQGSTTQYGQMLAEVQFTNAGGDATHIDRARFEPDGILDVRVYRDPTDVADTLDQHTFVDHVDLHYQSTNIGTKQKARDFYT